MGKTVERTMWVVAVLSLNACYMERPLTEPVPAPATHITAALSDSGTVAMSNLLGPGAEKVEGIIASADENNWSLLMVRVEHRDQRIVEWNHEPVTFSKRLLETPTVRTLDKKKSWLAAGAVTVGALLGARAFKLIGGEENKGTEPAPQQILIPGGGR